MKWISTLQISQSFTIIRNQSQNHLKQPIIINHNVQNHVANCPKIIWGSKFTFESGQGWSKFIGIVSTKMSHVWDTIAHWEGCWHVDSCSEEARDAWMVGMGVPLFTCPYVLAMRSTVAWNRRFVAQKTFSILSILLLLSLNSLSIFL